MIPSLIAIPSLPDLLLPPGIHIATLAEVAAAFATDGHRQWLFDGLLNAVGVLLGAGCSRIYLGGSFVTSKLVPSDYDGCWDPTGVRVAELDPVFINMPASKPEQKRRFRGEFWQGRHDLPGFDAFPKFFQQDTRTGARKGLLQIAIR
jgi:hypothetical protein